MVAAITELLQNTATAASNKVNQLMGAVRSLYVTDKTLSIKVRPQEEAAPVHVRLQGFEGEKVTFTEDALLEALGLTNPGLAESSIASIAPTATTNGELQSEVPEHDETVTWTFTPQPREYLDFNLLQDHALIFDIADIFENLLALFPGQTEEAIFYKSIKMVLEQGQGNIEQLPDGSYKFTPPSRSANDLADRKFNIKLQIGTQVANADAAADAEPQLKVELERTISVTEVVNSPNYNQIVSRLPVIEYWGLPANDGDKGIIAVDDPEAKSKINAYNSTTSRKAKLLRRPVKEHRPLIRVGTDLVYATDVKDNPWWTREHSFDIRLMSNGDDGATTRKTLVITTAPRPTNGVVAVLAESNTPTIVSLENLNLQFPADVTAQLQQVAGDTNGAKIVNNQQQFIIVPAVTGGNKLITLQATIKDDRSVISKIYSAIKNTAGVVADKVKSGITSFASKAMSFALESTKVAASTLALGVGLFFLGGGLLTPFYGAALEMLLVPFYLVIAAFVLQYSGRAASLLLDVGISAVKGLWNITSKIVTALTVPTLDAILLRTGFAQQAYERDIGKFFARGDVTYNQELDRNGYLPNPSVNAGANFDVVNDIGPARFTLPIIGFRWEYPDRPERFLAYIFRFVNKAIEYTGLHAHARYVYQKQRSAEFHFSEDPQAVMTREMERRIVEEQFLMGAKGSPGDIQVAEAMAQDTAIKEARTNYMTAYFKHIEDGKAKVAKEELERKAAEEKRNAITPEQRLASANAYKAVIDEQDQINLARKQDAAAENRRRTDGLITWLGGSVQPDAAFEEPTTPQQIQTTAGGGGGADNDEEEAPVRDRTTARGGGARATERSHRVKDLRDIRKPYGLR